MSQYMVKLVEGDDYAKRSELFLPKPPILMGITERDLDYVDARKKAEKLSREYGLPVADMPMLIQLMTVHLELRRAIQSTDSIITNTSEYHGRRKEERTYEVWHSTGSMSTLEGLTELFTQIDRDDTFMPIPNEEWDAVGNGSYNGQTIARVHLDDARKGDVPPPGTPYTIFVRLDKDRHYRIFDSGNLGWSDFRHDDRALMVAGGPESLEALTKFYFGKKKDGGLDRDLLANKHSIHKAGFRKQAKGRFVHLSRGSPGGFIGNCSSFGRSLIPYGSFVVGSVAHGESMKLLPSPDQIQAIINNPDLNRAGMIEAVRREFGQ